MKRVMKDCSDATMHESLPLLTSASGAGPSGVMPARCDHFAALDLVKTVAIVLVVLEHSMRSTLFVRNATWWEALVGDLSAACTPMFLYVSGFLADSRESAPTASLLRRYYEGAPTIRRTAWRLLVPYAVSAVVVACFHGALPMAIARASTLPQFLVRLLTFDILGLHYYVLLALQAAVALPAVRWACTADAAAAMAVLVVLVLCKAVAFQCSNRIGLSMWLQQRSPMSALPFFVLGYVTRTHLHRRVLNGSQRLRQLVFGSLIACLLPWLVGAIPSFTTADGTPMPPSPTPTLRLSETVALAREARKVLGACALPLVLTWYAPHRLCVHPLVRWASGASYTIYLYHMVAIDAYSLELFHEAHPQQRVDVALLVSAGPEAQPRRDFERALLGLGSSLAIALLSEATLGKAMALTLFGARLPFQPCGGAREESAG